jgi:CHAD domain-containing protein
MRSTLEKIAQRAANPTDRKALVHLADDSTGHKVTISQDNHSLRQAADILQQTVKQITQGIRIIDRWPSVTNRLSQAVRATKKSGKKALQSGDPGQFHEWRKKAKRLLYLLQLTQEHPGKRMLRSIRQVDELQETLGSYHDCLMVQERLKKNPPPHCSSGFLKISWQLLEKRKGRLQTEIIKIAGIFCGHNRFK